ncbi:ClpXP adapter SpxH family protein [Pedobacter ghigonis]|uniref:ClpXP adapter SpxH family protein n=1 Tax=Pedobacter ghigonis TaxID=2730403 RepID=UPI001F24E31D|nr:ClpXP adapter SpxH family protein [Pedobacter ghigonis]
MKKLKNMSDNTTKNNPLLCNPETGICEMPAFSAAEFDAPKIVSNAKPIKLIYFTDPICSTCWGIEPQLRKLKLEYGSSIEIEYRMGGLLPDWSYNSGGISKPSDVAHHWDEVSAYYDMPIDGDVWLEDPLDSSYPPSIAFKAAQLQDHGKAILFLRAIREMVFMEKKNITKWEHLAIAAKKSGLDIVRLKSDFEGPAKTDFEVDLKLARDYVVRGFPSLFFEGHNGEREFVYGAKPYAYYEMAVLKLYPRAEKIEYNKDWETLFGKYTSLTAKEFTELSGANRNEAEQLLNDLVLKGNLERLTTKNGCIWRLKA